MFRVPPKSTTAASPPRAGDDGDTVEVADEEGAVRRHELGVVDRRLVATAIADDVLLLHLLDQRLRVRVLDRDLAEVEH